jgi:type II secretory pathway pseudopilin PulG
MPIAVVCPHCHAPLQLNDSAAGQIVACTHCGKHMTAPPAAFPAPAVNAAPEKKSSNLQVVLIVLAVLGVVGVLAVGGLAAVLLPAVNNAREQSRKMVCASQTRQLSQAMQLYELARRKLSASYVVKNGHKHSWRIMLLPNLEQTELYKQYRFDEPWDGPNNRKLADQMPSVYRCPSDPAGPGDYTTNYFVVTGPGSVFEGDKAITMDAITARDGMSDTLLIVEAANTGIHWMEPRDLSVDDIAAAFDAKAGKFISSHHRDGANAAYADSRTIFLPDTIDAATLRAIITYDGGERVEAP